MLDTILYFSLNNVFLLILSIAILVKLIEFKIEYFPSKMRFYEDGYERYAAAQLYKKYYRNPLIQDIPPIKNNAINEG